MSLQHLPATKRGGVKIIAVALELGSEVSPVGGSKQSCNCLSQSSVAFLPLANVRQPFNHSAIRGWPKFPLVYRRL